MNEIGEPDVKKVSPASVSWERSSSAATKDRRNTADNGYVK